MKTLPELDLLCLPKEWRMFAGQLYTDSRDYNLSPERMLMVWRMGLDALASAEDHYKKEGTK